jgi:hypothetical protein
MVSSLGAANVSARLPPGLTWTATPEFRASYLPVIQPFHSQPRPLPLEHRLHSSEQSRSQDFEASNFAVCQNHPATVFKSGGVLSWPLPERHLTVAIFGFCVLFMAESNLEKAERRVRENAQLIADQKARVAKFKHHGHTVQAQASRDLLAALEKTQELALEHLRSEREFGH